MRVSLLYASNFSQYKLRSFVTNSKIAFLNQRKNDYYNVHLIGDLVYVIEIGAEVNSRNPVHTGSNGSSETTA